VRTQSDKVTVAASSIESIHALTLSTPSTLAKSFLLTALTMELSNYPTMTAILSFSMTQSRHSSLTTSTSKTSRTSYVYSHQICLSSMMQRQENWWNTFLAIRKHSLSNLVSLCARWVGLVYSQGLKVRSASNVGCETPTMPIQHSTLFPSTSPTDSDSCF